MARIYEKTLTETTQQTRSITHYENPTLQITLENWMAEIFLDGHKLCHFLLRMEERWDIWPVALNN